MEGIGCEDGWMLCVGVVVGGGGRTSEDDSKGRVSE